MLACCSSRSIPSRPFSANTTFIPRCSSVEVSANTLRMSSSTRAPCVAVKRRVAGAQRAEHARSWASAAAPRRGAGTARRGRPAAPGESATAITAVFDSASILARSRVRQLGRQVRRSSGRSRRSSSTVTSRAARIVCAACSPTTTTARSSGSLRSRSSASAASTRSSATLSAPPSSSPSPARAADPGSSISAMLRLRARRPCARARRA